MTDRSNEINRAYIALLTIVAALGGLLFGFDIAIITGAGPFIEKYFHLEHSQLGLGFAFASLLFGCMFGAFFAGRLTDIYGRKKILIYVAFLFIITSLLTGISTDYTLFIIVRFLGGIAVGAVSMLSPMYIAEVSPPKIRGMLVSCFQLSIVFGILISYLLNYVLRDTGIDNWRWMFMSGIFPAALFFGLLFLVPETPRFLYKTGKEEKAFDVLKKIGGESLANTEIAEIRESLKIKQGRFVELFKPAYAKMLFVGIMIAILNQVSGINAIIDYAPKIFMTAGFNIDSALFGTFGLGIVNCVFTLISLYTVDRFGRKRLFITGSAGMTLSLITLSYMSFINRFEGMLVLAACMVYLSFFSACIGPVLWTLLSEIFPNRMRGVAMMVPVVVLWFFNGLMVWLFPEMLKNFRTGTFLFIALMALIQLLFTIKWIPETKGKSLEEIEKLWQKPKN